MPSLDEIKRAGLEVSESSGPDQIMSLLSGAAQKIPAEIEKRKEKLKEDESNQVKLFMDLRQAGYSPEDATAKVQRTYRSTGFIERLLNGQGNAFQKPTGEDKISLEERKTKAELGKTKSETRKNIAQAGYYERRPGGSVAGQGYSIAQKRGRIADLSSVENELGIHSDDPDAALAARQELEILNEEIRTLSSKETPDAGGGAGKPAATVIMTGPDGKDWKIPATNVARARARGFKDKQKPVL